MEMYQLKAKCSGLADLMVKPKSGNGISATAKSAVRKIVKFDLFGYRDFEGNKYTEKGIALEEQAIKLSGRKRGLPLKKEHGKTRKRLDYRRVRYLCAKSKINHRH